MNSATRALLAKTPYRTDFRCTGWVVVGPGFEQIAIGKEDAASLSSKLNQAYTRGMLDMLVELTSNNQNTQDDQKVTL